MSPTTFQCGFTNPSVVMALLPARLNGQHETDTVDVYGSYIFSQVWGRGAEDVKRFNIFEGGRCGQEEDKCRNRVVAETGADEMYRYRHPATPLPFVSSISSLVHTTRHLPQMLPAMCTGSCGAVLQPVHRSLLACRNQAEGRDSCEPAFKAHLVANSLVR